MTSLPHALLEQLLTELSTLASVYHKPPESFVGKGRFGADEIQRAAILEQRQDAAENPIAASVAAASANGGPSPQSNVENLLDIDFDGAAPASAEASGTPPPPGAAGAAGGMVDMMGLFDAPAAGGGENGMGVGPGAGGAVPGAMGDIMSGFAGLDLSGASAPPPPGMQLHHSHGQEQKPSGGGGDDLLGLF